MYLSTYTTTRQCLIGWKKCHGVNNRTWGPRKNEQGLFKWRMNWFFNVFLLKRPEWWFIPGWMRFICQIESGFWLRCEHIGVDQWGGGQPSGLGTIHHKNCFGMMCTVFSPRDIWGGWWQLQKLGNQSWISGFGGLPPPNDQHPGSASGCLAVSARRLKWTPRGRGQTGGGCFKESRFMIREGATKLFRNLESLIEITNARAAFRNTAVYT